MIKGIGASNGIAIGKAFIINDFTPKICRKDIVSTEHRNIELNRFKTAVAEAENQLQCVIEAAEKNLGKNEVEIIKTQLLFLQDPEFVGAVEVKITSEGISSEYALQQVMDMYVSIFEAMDNEYMRERAADVKDIGGRIMNMLLGISKTSVADIKEQCIIVARDLTPTDTAQIVKDRVLGFITAMGGRTSHSAIMARTLDIPAVVGISAAIEKIKTGDILIAHGDTGEVIINPSVEVLDKYKKLQKEMLDYNSRLMALKELETKTIDGRIVELAGNIGNPDNAKDVVQGGGEGVGLFRTEFLYMNNHKLPTEEEQFMAYKEALENMGKKPVIIRTLDIGGDKKLPYLPIEEEQNPFLGYRAIRLCLNERDLFKTQLRALLRASAFGNLKIMFPMVSSVQEIREAKKLFEEAKLELREKGLSIKDNIPVGIMIEIPSAAIISDLLAKEVDFFSIGTNDLIQYTIAVDRMNEKVSYLYNPLHPGVLRLIKLTVDNAHQAGKRVGMCGEMAGDLRAVPLLIGMGLDELSVSAPSILKVKEHIRKLKYEDCRRAAEEVLSLSTSEEIEQYLKEKQLWQ